MAISEVVFTLHAVSASRCLFITDAPKLPGSKIIEYADGRWTDVFFGKRGLEDLAMLPGTANIGLLSRKGRSVTILPDKVEPIPAVASGMQSLTTLRAIGSSLFASGMHNQVFRRDGPDQWLLLSPDILTAIQALSGHDYIADLGGPCENELYLAGGDGCLFWDGRALKRLGPKTSQLTGVFVENERKIWLCGWEGVLMHGNHVDGFRVVDNRDDQMFLSLTKVEDRICLGATHSFWAYDGRGFGPERLGLPEADVPEKITQVSAAGDAVWASGGTAVLRHANGAWQRLR